MTSAITVPQSLIPRIARGHPLIPLDLFKGPGPAAHPGKFIELLDGGGGFLAGGLSDPENGVIRILSRDPGERLGRELLGRRAREALALRRRLGLIPEDGRVDAAFRLVNGEGDGLSGFLTEAFGPYLIQYVLARGLREAGRALAAALGEAAREAGLSTAEGEPWPRGILQKVRSKDAARPGKPVQEVVLGEEPPPKFAVREGEAVFEIHPLSGINVGLFTDMREHRSRIGRFARGARVLNTFAYTGSLSVAAALAGAAAVASVDLSSGVLKWARENFRLSGLDPERHRFEVGDVIQFLRREKEAGGEYDLVILDPPTYSAARAAAWSMKNDLPDLVAGSLALLAPGGILWLSANSHTLGDPELDAGIAAGAAAAGRDPSLLEAGGLPPDCPTPLSYPEGRYLKLRILRA